MLSSDFVLDWEKALGFRSDPFVDKILEPANQFLVNRVDEKERVNWFFIKGYFFGSVVGEHGVGKTMLLKWLEERLRKYAKVHCVYINAAVFREQINLLNQLITPLLSYYEKIWTKPHQRVVNFDYVAFLKRKLGSKSVALLIDNAHNLTDRNLEIIKGLHEEGLKIQIIVSTTQADFEKSRLGELGSDELNISLRRLTFEESKELIRKRIEASGGSGTEPFTEEILKSIYERADKNPRQFLHLCRDEAIRILIHKRELGKNLMGKSPQEPKVKQKKKLEKEPKHEPKVESRQLPLEQDTRKKGLFSVKFDFGRKRDSAAMRSDLVPPKIADKRPVIGNEKYNQELLNRLSGASPKKKANRDSSADVDKILKEISDGPE
jgi:type II secretory pathway predicted ATPase ExeA